MSRDVQCGLCAECAVLCEERKGRNTLLLGRALQCAESSEECEGKRAQCKVYIVQGADRAGQCTECTRCIECTLCANGGELRAGPAPTPPPDVPTCANGEQQSSATLCVTLLAGCLCWIITAGAGMYCVHGALPLTRKCIP